MFLEGVVTEDVVLRSVVLRVWSGGYMRSVRRYVIVGSGPLPILGGVYTHKPFKEVKQPIQSVSRAPSFRTCPS